MPTLCSGEGTGGLRWMGPVESKVSCSSPTPKEGPERVLYTRWGIFHPQRDLSLIFPNPYSQLRLSSWTEGIEVGEKEEVNIFVTSSQTPIILLVLHYTYLIRGETEAQRGCVIYPLPHSWKGQSQDSNPGRPSQEPTTLQQNRGGTGQSTSTLLPHGNDVCGVRQTWAQDWELLALSQVKSLSGPCFLVLK